MSKRDQGGRTPQKRTTSMKRDVHVSPRDNRWSVRKEGSSAASGRFVSKSTAINRAKGMASRAGGDVVIHGRSGTIVAGPSGKPMSHMRSASMSSRSSTHHTVRATPAPARRVMSAETLYADFWPGEQTADEINETIRRWRHEGGDA